MRFGLALFAALALAAQNAPDGSTPLHDAALKGDLARAKTLLAGGANPSATSRYNITPLSIAAVNGDAAMIELLLNAGANANSTSEEGEPVLMTASLTGKTPAMQALLRKGAKVNTPEPYRGQTAIMWAASEGNAEAIDLLAEFGADVKAKSKNGFTPLLFAVRGGHIEATKALLRHGANVNDTAPDTTSALNMAVVNAYFELASVLLHAGADPNAADPRGSALHTLAWLRKPGTDGAAGVGNTPHGPPQPTGNMTSLALAQDLLEHGANPNVRIAWQEKRFDKEGGTVKNPPDIQIGRHLLSYVGATPFYVAAQTGDAAYMRLLLAHGADGKLSTKFGITPLMAAAGLGTWEGETPGPFTGTSEAERLDAVKIALEVGNDVNAVADFGDYEMTGTPEYTLLYYPLNFEKLQDLGMGDPRWSGSTALIGAVVSGQAGVVKLLLEHGAKPDIKTKLGWTPLMVANGAFFSNAKKEFPAAAALISQALAKK